MRNPFPFLLTLLGAVSASAVGERIGFREGFSTEVKQ
jgi:hypothetical protein